MRRQRNNNVNKVETKSLNSILTSKKTFCVQIVKDCKIIAKSIIFSSEVAVIQRSKQRERKKQVFWLDRKHLEYIRVLETIL